ncbi:MAG: hypothetical protein U0R51_06715 [Solirubrobacterales bacterium]
MILLAAGLAAASSAVYLAWQPQPLDLAAQVFRADLWDAHGWVLYNDAWYAGHTVPGYSLLYPPLGAWLGPEALGVVCAMVSAIAFAAIAFRAYGERAWLGALWFGLGSTVALYGGRITFGLGLALGLLAVLFLQRRRPVLGALAALAAALASPVAGLYTVIAAAAVLIASRLGPIGTPARRSLNRAALAVLLAAGAGTAALALAFPTDGFQPFSTDSFVWIPIACAVCFAVLPVGETTLRAGIALYALVAILAFCFETPLGSNAIRLGATFAGPLMALALYRRRPVVLLLLAAPLLWWQWGATVKDVEAAAGDPATEAAFYAPLVAELERLGDGRPIRVEIPPTRSRWEAVYVAEHVPLARGWLRQMESGDLRRFTDDRLTAVAYAKWLRSHGVGYVAVPDAKLDFLAEDEAALVRSGQLSYLHEIWSNDDWVLWKVDPGDRQSVPLDSVAPDGYALTVPGPGRYLVRMRYSPYLRIVAGEGCLEPQGAESTLLTVPDGAGPQRIEVRASFSLGGLLRREPTCGGTG